MTDVGKAYVQIIPSADGISGSISKVIDPEAKSAGKSAGINIAGMLGKAFAAAGIGTAIAGTLKAALSEGGALQQSFGGLDTIYGEASASAKEFAMEASKMGISANTYAEQAVSFGAALKQAFGGDTQKAAEAANTAIADMADNAAKMGTPIESLQNAYQGFAKQNYTMLDNLKIGYGGTKTEMERLLADAQKITGVKYDISNLGDVYEAIHVIQGELGITGVAAMEAETTLTGSFNAMKASLQNFLGTLSTGGDISGPLSELISSAGTYLIGNLLPMVMNVVKALPGALSTALSTIGPAIFAQIQAFFTNAPELLESGVNMINNLVNGILSNLPSVIASAGQLITRFVTGILSNLPAVTTAAFNIISNLVSGLVNNFPKIVSAAVTAVVNFAGGIAQRLPTILQTGIQLIGQLAAGIISAIPRVIAAIPQIISGISSAFKGFNWAGIGSDILNGIASGLRSAGGALVQAAKDAALSAFNSAKALLKIGSPSKLFADGVGKWIPAGIAQGIEQNAGVINSAMADLTRSTAGDFTSGIRGDLAVSGMANAGGGFSQVVNIYSPQALTPAEVARQTRNQTQQMLLAVNGV